MGRTMRTGIGFVVIFFLVGQSLAIAAPRILSFGPRTLYVPRWHAYTITCVASGVGLQYQWWHQEPDSAAGHAIPSGEGFAPNRPRLTVPDAQQNRDYNGYYWCVVTDANGVSVESPHAQVIVVGPPTVTVQPNDETVTRGGTATFSVAGDPGAPVRLHYQWFFNNTAIIGATA